MKKFNLVCTNDDLRPTMGHVKITPDYIVATDGHMLMWDKPENNFDEDFCKAIPKEGFLIHAEDYKRFDKATVIKFRDKRLIEIHYQYKRKALIETEHEGSIGNYPTWQRVIPELKNSTALSEIGINGILYHTIVKAMDASIVNLKLVFIGADKAICIKEHNIDFKETGAIIMPYNVKDIL